jgi:hypothetical protein
MLDFLYTTVFAAEGDGTKLTNPLAAKGITSVQGLLAEVLKVVVQVGLVVVMFFIIYAGFLYVTAAGDETKIKAAHATFKNTIIGAIILLGAQVLATILDNTVKQLIGK